MREESSHRPVRVGQLWVRTWARHGMHDTAIVLALRGDIAMVYLVYAPDRCASITLYGIDKFARVFGLVYDPDAAEKEKE